MRDEDRSPSEARGLDRRAMLLAAGGTLAAYAVLGSGLVDPLRAARAEPTTSVARRRALTVREWHTLEAAQARILPSDALGPGATEVRAIAYLDAVLAEPGVSAETKSRVRDGAATLDRRAARWGQGDFAKLTAVQQDTALAAFERHADGVKWLKHMIGFTLEAFLGDPTHGGNPDMVGWRWAHVLTPKPRPTVLGWHPKERR